MNNFCQQQLRTHMEISGVTADPTNDYVRFNHPSIGRQSKPHPSISAHIHCKINGPVFQIEPPVQRVNVPPHAAGSIMENRFEAVLCTQVYTMLMGVSKGQWCGR